MKNNLLFAYGTLSDPEFIRLLLKRQPETMDAVLPDYGLFVHPENGYLFVKPVPDKTVSGKLFEISEDELKLIDLWEDVSLYQRELLRVKTKTGIEEAITYTQNKTEGIPADQGQQKSRAEILNDLREFLKETGRL